MKGENKMTNVYKTQGSQFLSANQKDNGSAQLRKSERSRSRPRSTDSERSRSRSTDSERSRSRSRERDNSVISKKARYKDKDCSQRDDYHYLSPPVKAKIIVAKAESDAPQPPPRSSRPVFTRKVHFSPSSSFRKSLNPDLTTRNVVNNTASDSHNCCSVQ